MRLRRVWVPAVALAIALGGAVPAVAIPVPAKKQSTKVTLTLPSSKTSVAANVKATIQVTPAGKRSVQIQTRSKTNTWETVATAKTDSSGKVKVDFTTYRSGDYKVRAVVEAKKGLAEAKSKSRSLKSTYGFGEPPGDKLSPMIPGALTLSSKAKGQFGSGQFTAGEFVVSAAQSGKPGLTVTDGAGRVAWASTPGKAFVTAARSKLRWFQRSTAGAFWPQVQRKARLTEQKVESVKASDGTVTIKGTVRGDGKKAFYTMTFKAVQSSPEVAALQMDVSFNAKKSD
ncbi:MAG: hypothetical protein MUF33_15140, partial [Candidatus Nanopelagicales bacterium]|nr:hypothetical protein [Candidatus Nanopelagicales bacterium]